MQSFLAPKGKPLQPFKAFDYLYTSAELEEIEAVQQTQKDSLFLRQMERWASIINSQQGGDANGGC